MVRLQKKPASRKKRERFNSDLKERAAKRPEKKPTLPNLADFYNSNSDDRSKNILEKSLKVSLQSISKQEEDYLNDSEDLKELAKYDAKKDLEKEWDSLLRLDSKQEEDDPDDWKDSIKFAKHNTIEELIQQGEASLQSISEQEKDDLNDWKDLEEFVEQNVKKMEVFKDASLWCIRNQKDNLEDWEDLEEFTEYNVEEEWNDPKEFLQHGTQKEELEEGRKVKLNCKEEEEKDEMLKGLEDSDEMVGEKLKDVWEADFEEDELKKDQKFSYQEEEAVQNMKDGIEEQEETLYDFAGVLASNDFFNSTQMYTRLMPSFNSPNSTPNPKVFKPATDLSPSPSKVTSMEQYAAMKVADTLNEWSGYPQVFMQQEQEVTNIKLIVGDLEPLSKLATEKEFDSPIIKEKIRMLSEKYISFRQISKDGNCFYRSFMFSYLEYIIKTRSRVEANRLVLNIEKCRNVHKRLDDDQQQFEHQFTALRELLSYILQADQKDSSNEELLDICRDPFISNALVSFFRLLTAIEIRGREEFFQPFIQPKVVDEFCRNEVVEMGEYADQWQIVALSDALAVPIEIVCLDQSTSSSGEIELNTHIFSNPESTEAQTSTSPVQSASVPRVTLLYTAEHYVIIYPK